MSSVTFRRDKRSLEEFKDDIKKETAKESFLLKVFEEECGIRGIPFEWKDNGIDNNGEFVERSDCRPDYWMRIGPYEGLFEIKASPVDYKCTFKVYDLEQYIRANASILLFYGTGKISENFSNLNREKTCFAVIAPEAMIRMLRDFKPYREKAFGFKLCVKVYKKNFDKYFTSCGLKNE